MNDRSHRPTPPLASSRIGRRGFLRWMGGLLALTLVAGHKALAAIELSRDPPPEHSLDERLNPILQGRTPKRERVTLELPEIAEDGRVVPVRIAVESPMTERDFVRRVHLIVDRNPDPGILTLESSPALGAEWTLKIRMRDSSNVRVIAEMSDGSLYGNEVAVIVNKGGCD